MHLPGIYIVVEILLKEIKVLWVMIITEAYLLTL